MPHPQQVQSCIDLCTECHDICTESVTHCLERGGKHAEASHVRLLLDCADICRTNGDLMLRGSNVHSYTCAACAEICDRCASSCDQFGNDPEMKGCAEICRRCAQSCRDVSGLKAA